MKTNTKHVAVQLSDEVELCCDRRGCNATAHSYGVDGFNGYVEACAEHAQELVEQRIAEGAMVPDDEV